MGKERHLKKFRGNSREPTGGLVWEFWTPGYRISEGCSNMGPGFRWSWPACFGRCPREFQCGTAWVEPLAGKLRCPEDFLGRSTGRSPCNRRTFRPPWIRLTHFRKSCIGRNPTSWEKTVRPVFMGHPFKMGMAPAYADFQIDKMEYID